MVLGTSRLDAWLGDARDEMSQCTWWCWALPDPRRVVRCPAWGNGPRIATGPKAPLGPGRTSLIEPGFAQFSQGSPLTGLPGLRATRSRRGHADPGGRAVFFGYQCADVGREPGSPGSQTAGGCGRVVGEGRRRTRVARGFPPSSVRLARTVGTPLWAWCHVLDWVLGPRCWVLGACPAFLVTSTPPSCRWYGLLVRLLQAGQGGEHGERVVDEASAGPGH